MRASRPIPSRLHLAHTPLPGPDLVLAAHAHDLVELGAWILASGDAALLTVVLSADERDAAMPVMPWGASRLPDHRLAREIAAPGYRFGAVGRALTRAADDLLLALSPRWPGSAPPRRLGVVTDGTGLGFSPDDPWPLAPGWMSRQVRDAHCLTCLLPFSPAGAWAMPTRSVA